MKKRYLWGIVAQYMKLTDKDIKQLAQLMKLDLNDKEVEKFRGEISSILEFVGKLKEVDVSGVPEVGQVTGEQNNWRKDTVVESEATPEDLLNAAPERKDDYIKVPGVFNND